MAATYFILKAAPPDLPRDDPAVRLMYFGWVVELGLKRKDWELARGLNAQGKPLPVVRPETAKHRKSAMTPSGKGDRNAPYLMPGRGLSRTRSLLAGKPHENYAEFWWRYDAFTGDQWGKILAYHAKRGKAYDVVGLSPQGQAWVAAQALAKWRKWKAGTMTAPTTHTPQVAAQISIPLVGRTNLDFATEGIGGTLDQARRAIAEGRSSGFLSAAEWRKHFTKATPSVVASRPGTSRSVQKGKSNVLLQHVWGDRRMTETPAQMLDRAVNNLVAALQAGRTVAQIESLLGDQFAEALVEAVRRGVVVVAMGGDGRTRLRVVG